ncbi:MAG: type IV pilus twitching motility protein PilT [Candidatus Omnitrophica bacterium]|nr:type IV pilus twitching motility protein PilT [Candidatus Omnitrophota bacterium]
MAINIDILLRTLVIKKSSDLHFQAGSPPIFRVNGELSFSDLGILASKDIEKYMYSIMTEGQRKIFEESHRFDFSYSVPGIARFRVNVYRQRGCVGAVMRCIPFEVPTIEDLGLPSIVKELAAKPNGMVLITGPTGSGKSTTLAAIIGYINASFRRHVITIEDPIEFVHQNKLCEINQREVGIDTESFASALRDALREDPNVILVGEMRDLETISNAITAAETGHLVFATLHTNDAAQTVDRIVDVFPPHQQPQVRMQLSTCLRAVIAQTLLRRKDGAGRIAAFEIMLANPAVKNLIKEGKTSQLYSTIQTARQEGMQLLDQSLENLCKNGLVTVEEASTKVNDHKAFERAINS